MATQTKAQLLAELNALKAGEDWEALEQASFTDGHMDVDKAIEFWDRTESIVGTRATFLTDALVLEGLTKEGTKVENQQEGLLAFIRHYAGIELNNQRIVHGAYDLKNIQDKDARAAAKKAVNNINQSFLSQINKLAIMKEAGVKLSRKADSNAMLLSLEVKSAEAQKKVKDLANEIQKLVAQFGAEQVAKAAKSNPELSIYLGTN